MRIISGKHKGKRLTAPKKLPVRPTTDMAKESLFNIFNNWFYFHDVTVLDLFSGTGNITYEFLSRGCEHVVLVEQNLDCVKFINKTLSELDFKDRAWVNKQDVFKFLKYGKKSFDIIFADPPYEIGIEKYAEIAERVFDKKLLKPGGVLTLEHSEHLDLSELPFFDHTKRYGGVNFSFFMYPLTEGEEE